MKYVDSKHYALPFCTLLSLILGVTLSACRPSIDDNTSSDDLSNVGNSSITPDKLSQAYLPLAGGTMTGALTAPSFSGDGSALTNLNASNLASGTLNIARFPTGTSGQILTTNGTSAAWAVPNYFVRDQSRDLVMANNATSPNSKLDLTASEILLKNTSDYPLLVSSVSLTLDITVSGTNGLDTGAEANSTWYHIWVISDGTTAAGLFSTSATAPTLPTGYTYKAYIGAVYNGAGGNFIRINQRGRRVATTLTSASSSCPGGGYTSVSFTSTLPTTATSALLRTSLYSASGLAGNVYTKSSDGSSYYSQLYVRGPGGEWFPQTGWVVLTETQTAYWDSNGATSCDLSVAGWEF